MRGKLIGAVFTTMALLGAAGAQASGTPQITDPAGDANGLNVGDTRPASYDPADLLSVRFETTYDTIPVGDDGLHYEPTGLVIRFTTLAPARSDGPTLEFSIDGDLDGCPTAFHGWVAGPLTNPGDGRTGSANWTIYTDCPDPLPLIRTAATAEHERFTTVTDAATGSLVLTYPFEALTSEQRDVLNVGTRIGSPRAYTQTSHGAYLVGTFGLWADLVTFDLTDAGSDFVIGEDVPKDRECTKRCPERKPDRDADCRLGTGAECPPRDPRP